MEKELEPMCEKPPGPMDHAKVERKSTVMYSTTGVKVTRPQTCSPANRCVESIKNIV